MTPRERLKKVINIASSLCWFEKNPNGYPKMLASEVEKCLEMMVCDVALARYEEASKEPTCVELNRQANPNWVSI